jgi:hypothetical protein
MEPASAGGGAAGRRHFLDGAGRLDFRRNRGAAGKDADDAALCDALAIEHSTIYGYGMVSALSPPSVNDMVVEALGQHRQRRDDVIAMLNARKVTAPVAAPGYQLPILVGSAADAARLAARLDVIDNGHGVPDALRENLFLPLVSGRADGTGLGLALAQEIAREHGGVVVHEGHTGQTVFSLLLPLGGEHG